MFLSLPSSVRQLFVHHEQIIPPLLMLVVVIHFFITLDFPSALKTTGFKSSGRPGFESSLHTHTHDSRARVLLLLVVNGAAVALLLAPTLALEAKQKVSEEEPPRPGLVYK